MPNDPNGRSMPNAQPYRTTSSIATSEVGPAVSNPDSNSTQNTPQPSSNNKIPKLIAALAAAVFVVATASGAALLYRARHSNTTNAADIQSFTYGMVSGPLNTFYPHNGTNIDEIVVNEQIFEGLVIYRDKKIVGNLATSWKNPDANTWVFTLRPHVTFHTGRTMQASDVVASLKAVQGTEVGDLYANTIQGVTALDSQTVQITTAAPDPILLNKLVFLYITDSRSKQADNPINGTGPYTLAPGSKPTQKSLQLNAYSNYHGGHVSTRKLTFKVYEDDASMAAAMKAGQVNLANFSSIQVADGLKKQFKPLYLDDPSVFGLMINTTSGPLKDLRVRQALYQAIDPQAFLQHIGMDGAPANQAVVSDIPGYNPSITSPGYDQQKAKALLTQAGYGKGFTLQFTYLDSVSLLGDIATELTRQLEPVGIHVEARKYDRTGYDSLIDSGKAESYFLGCSSDVLDLSDVASNCIVGPYYQSTAVDQALSQANQTLDRTKRLAMLQTVSKQLMDDVAFVPVYHGKAAYMLDKPYHMPIDIPATSYPGAYFWRMQNQ